MFDLNLTAQNCSLRLIVSDNWLKCPGFGQYFPPEKININSINLITSQLVTTAE